jgi:hypothetical protein
MGTADTFSTIAAEMRQRAVMVPLTDTETGLRD